MEPSDFIAEKLVQQGQCHSFSPTLINCPYKWTDPRIDVLLEEANRHVGELNAGYRRNRLFAFSKYILLFSDKT